MKIVIENVRIIDPAHNIDTVSNIYLDHQTLVAKQEHYADFNPDKIIDASNQILIPGAVDLFATIPHSGRENQATLETELNAAKNSGISAVCCSPALNPVADTPAIVELLLSRVQMCKGADAHIYGALTSGLKGQQLSNMAALKQAGCVAVTNAYVPIENTALLRHSFEYAATYDILIILIPQDYALARLGYIHEGKVSARTGLRGIPEVAESIDVARALQLAEFTGARLHFSQISTAKSVELIADAKAKGLPITCDVSINQLFLSEIDVSEYDTNCYVYPPLRDFQNQQALVRGLQNHTIDAICSAHMPLEPYAKQVPFTEALPGISSLDIFVPLSFRLVLQNKLSWSAWVSCISTYPKNILQLKNTGLNPGEIADFFIFDPEKNYCFNREKILSKGLNTPYQDWPMQGKVTANFIYKFLSKG